MKHPRFVSLATSTALIAFLAMGLAPVASAANTATTSFNVKATVVSACLVNATDMVFGTVVPSTTAPTYTTTQSSISVTCSTADAYTVALGAGNSGVETVRYMKGVTATNHLLYGLFSDSNRTNNWGTTAGTTVAGIGNGSAQVLPVYGQISTQTSAPAIDTYSDSITVTVTY